MRISDTYRMMYEKKDSPPWNTGKQDYAGAAKELRDYAMKDGGIDKKDMLAVASQLASQAKSPSASVGARMMRNIQGLDTDVREKIHSILKKHGLKESLESDLKLVEEMEEIENEELEEAKRDPSKSGGTGYDLYHKDFSTAMKHAYDYAKKKFGITIDPKEIDDKVASGPRKPSAGKTNSYRLKGDKGSVQIQVANLDNKKYELNMYKESVELTEREDTAMKVAREILKMGVRQSAPENEILKRIPFALKKLGLANDKLIKRDPDFAGDVIGDFRGMKEDVDLTEATLTFDADPATYKRMQSVCKDNDVGCSYQGKKAVLKGDEKNILRVMYKMKFPTNVYQGKIKEAYETPSEVEEAYKTPSEASAYEAGKKAVAKGVSYDDNPNKKGTKEYTAWSKGHNDARARKIARREEVEMENIEEAEFFKWEVKVGGRSWKGTARNAGEAVKKARPSMGNLDLSKASVTRIKEDVDVEEKTLSLEEAVMLSVFGEAKKDEKKDKKAPETDKDDDGEGMDAVDKKALKKDYDDRAKDGDGDLDNDGDEDKTDKYLHKRRQAVTKAIAKKKGPESSKKGEPVDTNPTMDEEKGEEMSSAEKEKKDEIMKKLEQRKQEFEDKYGDRAKEVMARTAIKMAKKHA